MPTSNTLTVLQVGITALIWFMASLMKGDCQSFPLKWSECADLPEGIPFTETIDV